MRIKTFGVFKMGTQGAHQLCRCCFPGFFAYLGIKFCGRDKEKITLCPQILDENSTFSDSVHHLFNEMEGELLGDILCHDGCN